MCKGTITNSMRVLPQRYLMYKRKNYNYLDENSACLSEGYSSVRE